MKTRVWPRVAALAALLLVPSVVVGYGVIVHNLVPIKALGNEMALGNTPVKSTTLPGVGTADIERFRRWFYDNAKTLPDTAVRNAFVRRYPTPAAFDARAFKELLMLNGDAGVFGIDSFPAVYRARHASDARLDPYPQYAEGNALPLPQALAMGSIWPDFDRRNRDRLVRGPDGGPRLTTTGDTIPFDPMTLNMGRLTGPTSQAHAHYGLNHLPKSSDPASIRSAPWNYAVARGFPGEVETYAERNAEIYTDLALLTLLEGGNGMSTLSSIYAGSAFHYIADVANAVHTLQGGTPSIANDVTLARIIRQIKAGFGLWGKVPSVAELSLDILSNLHSLSERVFQVELSEALSMAAQSNVDAIPASMRDAPTALTRGDTAMAVNYRSLVNNALRGSRYPEFGSLIAAGVIDDSYESGAEILRLTRLMANTDVRRASAGVIDFDTIPDAKVWTYVSSRADVTMQAALRKFNDLQIKGLKRANEAVTAWWYTYGLVAQPPANKKVEARNTILGRLVRQQLAYLTAAEARRTTWIGTHGGARN
jgi:hypothetical protein